MPNRPVNLTREEALARFSANVQPCTLSLGEGKESYLQATMAGENTAVGWVVRAGRTVAFVEGELFNSSGELLAKGSSSARLVPSSTH